MVGMDSNRRRGIKELFLWEFLSENGKASQS
jgi:hypothetical protein